ncbi:MULTISPECIES: 50S ribosomal protein L1 [Candidatus Nitrosocaldus]|uniref:Large ribosomal subunit protein uL1 n=1 Tax=Candidatus Nitrosocaldus cavascurensis TaxID=2058097 RepID=A0A2K5ASV9_9ARCH|nr:MULTISPECIES: 50S ribosomal protein L1 [Candidatus Nitrosocaldus]SPC34707.1 50S ribosomal protein L1p [Candidatus Nitrosocaldus cavascurensis]
MDLDLLNLVKEAREKAGKRNFKQSVDLILVLKDIDVKKGFSINEVVALPHTPNKKAKVCVIASGDLALRARRANADKVIEGTELSALANNKREAKKLSSMYDFFLADTQLMPTVGKVLGPVLGPKGKMAMPLPFNAQVDAMLDRLRSSTRARTRNQLMVACRIGDEDMDDKMLAENAMAVINAVEKKLPAGERNIAEIMLKFTMGRVARLIPTKVVAR